jgi:hypothetical protein
MKKERKLPRRHLIYYLRVFDRQSGEQVGSLVDITTEGLMLVSEKPLQPHKTYHLRMDLPTEVCGKERLDFDAVCMWSNNDINPLFYDNGFMLPDVNSQEALCIEDLITIYGFRD